ncbi:MAG: hypothetical protein OEX07_02890 [Gammaproteobacteria bacterium]|nr:hypothetical protein [Gammaproteobacteria bacterium]
MQFTKIFRFITFSFVSIFVLLQPLSASASLGARPAYLFVDLEKRNPSGTFTVTNMSDEKQTYRANAIHFAISEKGAVQPVAPDDFSLAKWIKFNPKEFTLEPKTSREIRFSIIRKKNLQSREYWGAIEFMPLKGIKYSGETDEGGRKMKFEVLTALLIPIYGSMNGIEYEGKVSNVTAEHLEDKTGFTALVENTGTGVLRLKGELEVLDAASGNVALKSLVSTFNVMPHQKRRIKILGKEALPGGRYTAMLRLQQTSPDDVILSHQEEFQLP